MRWILALTLACIALPCASHDRSGNFVISQIWQSISGSVRAIVDDTHEGYKIRCALYDAEGTVLAVTTVRSKEFATRITFTAETFGINDVVSYSCIQK